MKHLGWARSALALMAAMAVWWGLAAGAPAARTAVAPEAWKVGLARVPITPDPPVWMAGYASRTRPADGKQQELYAKALALEDDRGTRVVIVTTDLLGLPREVADEIARGSTSRYRLPRQSLVLTSSHTHSGPVIGSSLRGAYIAMNEAQDAAVRAYTKILQEQIIDLIGAALVDLTPARISFGRGAASFGVNRREFTPQGVKIGVNREGPVDPEVPVLAVTANDGRLRGVLFSYACHNTTLTGEFYQYAGDYAGSAQQLIERAHPGAMALYMMGCGADINPFPRSRVELAEAHGAALARSIDATLKELRPLDPGPLRASFEEVALPFAPLPTRDEWQARAGDQNPFNRAHAQRWLSRLERRGRLPTSYQYPIQVVRLGDSLTLVALAGEVVVDYALRLKRELAPDQLWIVAYSNDLCSYIPSARILKEGGYEAEGSMIYYDLPGPYAPEVEEIITSKVRQLVRRGRTEPVRRRRR